VCQGAAAAKAKARAYEHQLHAAEMEQHGKNIVTKVKQTDYAKNKDAINLAHSRRKADIDYKVAITISNALKNNEALAKKFAQVQKVAGPGRSTRAGKAQDRAALHMQAGQRAQLANQIEGAQISMRAAGYEMQSRQNAALTKLGIPPSPTIAPPKPVFKGWGEKLTEAGIQALSIATGAGGAGAFGQSSQVAADGTRGNKQFFDFFTKTGDELA
tara:strand:- start:6607 stop:7251 length:645 start_codon:yes stop_codon:yes gene_type:complete